MRYLKTLHLRIRAYLQRSHIAHVIDLMEIKERELAEDKAKLDALVRQYRRTMGHIAQRTDPQTLIREIGRSER